MSIWNRESSVGDFLQIYAGEKITKWWDIPDPANPQGPESRVQYKVNGRIRSFDISITTNYTYTLSTHLQDTFAKPEVLIRFL